VLVSQRRSSDVAYYLHDGQMSTRLLTDAAGVVTDRYDYDAFGNTVFAQGTTVNPFLYNGQQLDPNVGFYYLRARYYDQQVGRFTAMDPFEGRIFDPASLHPYSYAHNDPVNRHDPTGRYTLGEAFAAAAISGVLSGLAVGSYEYSVTRSVEGGVTAGLVTGATAFFISLPVFTAGVGAAGVAAAAAVGGSAASEQGAFYAATFARQNQRALEALFRSMHRGASREFSTAAARQTIARYLILAEARGIPRHLMACAFMHSLRFGHAAGLTVGIFSLDRVVEWELKAVLQAANYACPAHQRAGR
jgi:RHS repeat-associated protein